MDVEVAVGRGLLGIVAFIGIALCFSSNRRAVPWRLVIVGVSFDEESAHAMKYVRNEQDADDVAQDALLLAHRYRESFRGESRYSTWLYRVAANHCKNRIKYLSRRNRTSRDGLDGVIDGGAAAVIPPGGSVRDDEVIAAADERGIAMVFTGVRHFRH